MFNRFIKATNEYTDKNKNVPAPYIRRAFELDFAPERATVSIVASGFYELYVNGARITKGYLAPYISNPDDVLFYDVYDVAPFLKRGKNAVGVILGNGFANQSISSWDFDKAEFRDPLCCSLELEARFRDSLFALSSDESFKTHPSHIVYDMYRYGTHVDARREVLDWSNADFDDSGWQNVILADAPKGDIVPCVSSPIVKRYELKPVSVIKQKDICYLKTAFRGGEDVPTTRVSGYLYDFGMSTAGVCRLKINGAAGQTVTLRHCERLSDSGEFAFNSIYTFKSDYAAYIHLFQTDVYTLRGDGTETFVPPFTYHGFRYVFVEGITEEQATPDLLTFEVISSDIARRSEFSTSDEKIQMLYNMGVNADLSNFHYFPTDCPHREKNGWTGDISVSADQLLLSFECSDDFSAWLKMLARAQRDDGSLPGIVPTSGWGFKWGNGPMWDSAAVTVPYYAYKYDGRVDILRECSDMIFKYLKYVASRRDGRGLVAIGLGDWCQPRAKNEEIAAPLVLTDSVTVYDIARKSAFIFGVVGDGERREYAEGLATEMRSAIREHLIDFDSMSALGNCQTSQTLIISHCIVDKDEKKAAYDRLTELIHEKDDHAYCGMIGLRYIFEVLAEGGDIDLALRLICRDDEPSYGSMIKRGATALCEATMENGLNESENHHFLGDIVRIFHNYVGGLRVNPYMRDINEVIFAPKIPKDLDRADGTYRFSSGVARFGWCREGCGVRAYITVPKGVVGFFEHTNIRKTLEEGYNEFFVEL